MKVNKKAFTLVELLVAITLATSLMLWVSIFITNGIKNITDQKVTLDNIKDQVDFFSVLQNRVSRISSVDYSSWSWVLFQITPEYDNWGFVYLWTKTLSWTYCQTDDSDYNQTKHLYLKTFIPFEEIWEDMFNGWNYLTWKVINGWDTYISETLNHQVLKNNNRIVWRDIFWDFYKNATSWTWNYLNKPTWITYDSSNKLLFISDTLNNRILYYSPIVKKIYKLLDENDGLNFPTWLDYSDWSLYISNTGNWEILEYSWKGLSSNTNLLLDWFSEDINEIDIWFFWNNLPDLANTWDWIIDWYLGDYYLTWTTDTLKYYFINYWWINDENDCIWKSNWDIIFQDDKPKIYCTQSWSWKTASYPTSSISKIEIDSLNWFTNTWSYYVDLKLYDWDTLKYNELYQYFTQWDNKLSTKDDNTLKIITWSLNYPTWIELSWWNIVYNDFLDRKKYTINLDWTIDSSEDLNDFDFENLEENKQIDYLLEVPIKDLKISENNWVLTIIVEYYKKYNCSEEGDRVVRTMIFKKNISD